MKRPAHEMFGFALLITLSSGAAAAQGGQGGLAGGGIGGGNLGRLRDSDVAAFSHILTPGDRGEWPITAKEGETIIVRAVSTVFDPAIEIVDSGGKMLAKNDDIRPGEQNPLVLIRFPRPGQYKILVKGYKSAAGGQYQLLLRRFVAQNAALGSPIAGPVDPRGVKWLRVTAKAGQTLAATVRAAAFNPDIDVYAPNGELLVNTSSALGTSRTQRAIFRAETPGDHYVRIQSDGSDRASFSAMVVAARVIPTTVGAENTAHNLEAGGLDVWTFEGAPGDLVRVEARASGAGVHSSLEFVPPAGKAGEIEAADAAEAIATLPSDPKGRGLQIALLKRPGKYQITVSQPLGMPTEYTLSTRNGAVVWPQSQETTGSLGRGESDYWRVSGSRGRILQVAGSSDAFDLGLEVYDGRGERIGANDDGGGSRNALLTTLLPANGDYLVRVHAFGDGGSGAYRLARKVDPFSSLSTGQRTEGVIGAGSVGIWSFQGRAGQTVILSVRSGEFDPHARLYGPDALEFAADDDGGDGTDSLISVRLPADGLYTVWVTGKQGSGRYIVRLLDLDQ